MLYKFCLCKEVRDTSLQVVVSVPSVPKCFNGRIDVKLPFNPSTKMKDLLNILISDKTNKLINTEEYIFEATKDEMEGLEMDVKFPLVDMEASVYQCRVRKFDLKMRPFHSICDKHDITGLLSSFPFK